MNHINSDPPSSPEDNSNSLPMRVFEVAPWEVAPNFHDAPELSPIDLISDSFPDRSESYVSWAQCIVESVKDYDRNRRSEDLREFSIEEACLIEELLTKPVDDAVRLLIEINEHRIAEVVDPIVNSYERSLFIEVSIEWLSVIEHNIEYFSSYLALDISRSKARLQLMRHRLTHLHASTPFELLPNNFQDCEIVEMADCCHEKGKFAKGITASAARFIWARLLGKDRQSSTLSTVSNNNKTFRSHKKPYPFVELLLSCEGYRVKR